MFHQHFLKNKLRLITVPMPATQAVTVLLLVKVGSRQESEQQAGLSHFLEHMFFKGTKKRPNTRAIASALDAVGGKYNAFTSKEYTGFWIKVAKEHLDLALDVLSDMLLNSKLEAKEIAKEKGVILQEINMYQDTPMAYIHELWEQAIFAPTALGRLIIGTAKSVSNLKRQNFLAYWHKHYQPANLVLTVAGAEDKLEGIESKVSHYFIRRDKAIEQKVKPALPAKLIVQAKDLYHFKKTDQIHLALGFKNTIGLNDDRRYAAALIAIALGGNMSSRLFLKLREQAGLAYYVHAEAESFSDQGYLAAFAGVDKNNLAKAKKIIRREYHDVYKNGIKAQELRRAKEYLKGQAILDWESSEIRASFYGLPALFNQRILTLEQKLAKIEAVQAGQIADLSRQILAPNKLKMALIGPIKNDK